MEPVRSITGEGISHGVLKYDEGANRYRGAQSLLEKYVYSYTWCCARVNVNDEMVEMLV